MLHVAAATLIKDLAPFLEFKNNRETRKTSAKIIKEKVVTMIFFSVATASQVNNYTFILYIIKLITLFKSNVHYQLICCLFSSINITFYTAHINTFLIC